MTVSDQASHGVQRMMLRSEFISVGEAASRDVLLAEVMSFTQRLGFETATLTAVVDRSWGETEFAWVENAPAAYVESLEHMSDPKRDPVMRHCKRFSSPIVWDQDTYVAANLGAKWEHQAQFGYRTGIAVALHLPKGQHLFIGVD
jgi:hypothetical protein